MEHEICFERGEVGLRERLDPPFCVNTGLHQINALEQIRLVGKAGVYLIEPRLQGGPRYGTPRSPLFQGFEVPLHCGCLASSTGKCSFVFIGHGHAVLLRSLSPIVYDLVGIISSVAPGGYANGGITQSGLRKDWTSGR